MTHSPAHEAFVHGPDGAAVVDGGGTIVAVNRAWERFGQQQGADAGCGVGADYLAVCRRAAGRGAPAADAALQALTRVLEHRTPVASALYPCVMPRELRWFRAEVFALPGEGVGVRHLDVTGWLRSGRPPDAGLDPATGLPDRRALEQWLADLLAGRCRGQHLALLVARAAGPDDGCDAARRVRDLAVRVQAAAPGADLVAQAGPGAIGVVVAAATAGDVTAVAGRLGDVLDSSAAQDVRVRWGLARPVAHDTPGSLLLRAQQGIACPDAAPAASAGRVPDARAWLDRTVSRLVEAMSEFEESLSCGAALRELVRRDAELAAAQRAYRAAADAVPAWPLPAAAP